MHTTHFIRCVLMHFIRFYTTFYKLFYIFLYFYLFGITLFCRFALVNNYKDKTR